MRWSSRNGIQRRPGLCSSQPDRPRAREAAKIVSEAWKQDAEWGAYSAVLCQRDIGDIYFAVALVTTLAKHIIEARWLSSLADNVEEAVMTVSPQTHVHKLSSASAGTDWPYDIWEQAMRCRECAVQVLLLMLKSPAWVLRRVERVSFHDDRTARRRVSTDFSIPELAPYYQVGEDARVRLVPLTVMRRKTLVNFGLTDAEGKALSLVSMRHNQVLTEQIVLALADITPGVTCSTQLQKFARDLASGTQQELLDAFEDGESNELGPDVSGLLGNPAAALLLRRLVLQP